MEAIYENNEEMIADFGSPGFLPVVSMTELYNSVYESKPPIVEGLLYPGTYLFVGSPKYGKSFLMLQLTYHISTGLPTFGFPYVVGDTMYVVTGVGRKWGAEKLDFLRSKDLIHWEKYSEVHLPGWEIYNMNIAEMNGVYTLLIEISAPAEEAGHPYTFRFLQSTDMTNWVLTPSECVFQKDRYSGSPSIYTFPDDPYYYVGYLEGYPNYRFGQSLARSKDLINWEYSPLNPVLMYNDFEDKQIASAFLSPADRKRIEEALDTNNSDMEMCEYLGRTLIYYSWGDQRGTEFLAEAWYEGPMHELLKSFFEPKE